MESEFRLAWYHQYGPAIWLALHSLLVGLALAVLLYEVARVVWRPVRMAAEPHEFEAKRRIQLRKASPLFRWFEPYVDDVSEWLGSLKLGPKSMIRMMLRSDHIERSLNQNGPDFFWRPIEFAGAGIVAGGAVAIGSGILFASRGATSLAVVAPLAMAFMVYVYRVAKLNRIAAERMARLKQRLPYSVDLIALLLQSGAQIGESYKAVAVDSSDHPVGEEFSRVLKQQNSGSSFDAALEAMSSRLWDDDVAMIANETISSAALGTSMSEIYRRLSDKMRERRQQDAAKRSSEAQAMIVFPGLLIAASLMLMMITPFVLKAFRDYQ